MGVTVLQVGAVAHAEPTPSATAITPNAAIQREIARCASAANDAQLQPALDKLRALGGPDFVELIPQLVYYLANAKDLRDAMMPGVISDRLQITPAQLRAALAPYRNTSDPKMKQQIDNLLQGAGEAPADSPAGAVQ
jgi:hypothetical protein